VAENIGAEITHPPSATDRIQHKDTQNKGKKLQDISVFTATTEYSFTEYEI
jgi:hypothetical protein